MVSQTAAPGAAVKSLSSNDAIQFLLADIPIFTVGILAFGTLTFFALMKRMDRWVFCLHLSVLLSFLASLLDLSQLLLRGNSSRFNDDAMRLIDAREIFYSFANALRFLFYWGFIAVIPLGETIPEGQKMHSGSWSRWGLLGRVLKWSTLLLILVMTILQIVYRDVPAFDKIGSVYEAEAGLEIILSAVFILKLLLNTWARFPVGTVTPSKGKMLVQYLPAIVALMFSLWIAVGNVILFEFTETALGRFMRALELYVLLVYILTISFYHLRFYSFYQMYRPTPKRASQYTTFRRASVVKSDYTVRADDFPQPPAVNLMQILEGRYRDPQEIPQTVERSSERSLRVESANQNQHQSMAARLSTWLGMNRPLPDAPSEQQTTQPWDVDAERGPSPVIQIGAQPWQVEEDDNVESPSLPQRILEEDERRGVTPLPPLNNTRPSSEEPERPLSLAREQGVYAQTKEADNPEEARTPVTDRDWQEVEFSNAQRYSGIGVDIVARALRENIDRSPRALREPIDRSPDESSMNIEVVAPPSNEGSRRSSAAETEYIASPYPSSPLASANATPIPKSRPLPPMPGRPTSMLNSPLSPVAPDSARSSNMSLLLRRQNELDKSIEALRLFSPSKVSFDLNAMPVQPIDFYSQPLYAQEPQGAELSPVPSAGSPEPLTPGLTLATPRAGGPPESSVESEFDLREHLPPLNRSSMDSGVIPVPMAAAQAEHQLELRPDTSMNELVPPRMPASRFSDSSSVGDRRERVDSHGTQYDITSFVGNLTIPDNPKDSIQSASSTMFSEDGFVRVATVTTQRVQRVARPTLITQPLRLQNVESTAPPSTSPPASRPLPQVPHPQLGSQSPPKTQPGLPLQPGAPRFRRAVGLPPRPRLSVVNPTPVEETTTSPGGTETATLVSPNSGGSGTPRTGKAW